MSFDKGAFDRFCQDLVENGQPIIVAKGYGAGGFDQLLEPEGPTLCQVVKMPSRNQVVRPGTLIATVYEWKGKEAIFVGERADPQDNGLPTDKDDIYRRQRVLYLPRCKRIRLSWRQRRRLNQLIQSVKSLTAAVAV